MLTLFANWQMMGDWPFTAREMTVVHHLFLVKAQAEINERKRGAKSTAGRSMELRSIGNGAKLDRAFDAMSRSRR